MSCKTTEVIEDNPIRNEVEKVVRESPHFKLLKNLEKVNNKNSISALSNFRNADVQYRVYEVLQHFIVGNVWEIPLSATLIEDLQGDELIIMETIRAIEVEFTISIPDEDAEKIYTVGDIVNYVEERLANHQPHNPETPIDWEPAGYFEFSDEVITTVDLENDLKSYRNKFVNAYIYKAGTTLKFKTYEKIVMVKPIPVSSGDWYFDSISHLSINPEGSLTDMTVELLVNYTNGTIYNDDDNRLASSYAKMEYSFNDKSDKWSNVY